MTIKVKITTSNTGIIVKPQFNVPDSPGATPIVVKGTVNKISDARLDQLNDVVEPDTPEEGATLVYNSSTDKYEVQKLNLADVNGTLDGGIF
jgi:hypothetical protein